MPPPDGRSWSSLPPPPPPPSRWGFGDVLLGAVFILGVASVAGVLSVLIVGIPEATDTETASDLLADEPAVLVSSVLAQQLAMIGWVVWVARRKGQGVVREFGFRFRWIDLAIGLGAAVAALVVTNVVITALSAWANVDTVDNADFIDAPDQGLWIIPIVLMVVVGAPLSEELFFRGLVFRAAEKRWTTGLGIAVSTVAFALVHVITGVTAAENLILVAGIAIFGIALAVVTAQFRRLGPAIVAHALINGSTVAAILATT
ncbi:MAG: CPBP family intramembrane metalloprotease [Acidimicrobiia bacterium]|nr:CPBP family intramembrane metalloprotease [Acidimicrobiia bacterium]